MTNPASRTTIVGLSLFLALAVLAFAWSFGCRSESDPNPTSPVNRDSADDPAVNSDSDSSASNNGAQAVVVGPRAIPSLPVGRAALPAANDLVERMRAYVARFPALSLYVVAGVEGELQPCGCADGQRGGLLRLATVLQDDRAPRTAAGESAAVVLAGNNLANLLGGADALALAPEYHAARLALTAEFLNGLAPVASVRSPEELRYFDGLPFTALKGSAGDQFACAVVDVPHVGRVEIDVVHASATESPRPHADTPAPEADVRVLLALHAPPPVLEFLAPDYDIVVAMRMSPVRLKTATNVVRVSPAQTGAKELLRLDLLFHPEPATMGTAVLGELRSMVDTLLRLDDGGAAFVPSYAGWFEQFAADPRHLVHASYLPIPLHAHPEPDLAARLRHMRTDLALRHPETPPASTAEYLDRCRECHQSIVAAFEESSPHARAFETLQREERESDPECLRCHVTTFVETDDDGGSQMQAYAGVLCGACHTNIEDHLLSPGYIPGRVGIRTCASCHTSSQSPEFDFGEYSTHVVCANH